MHNKFTSNQWIDILLMCKGGCNSAAYIYLIFLHVHESVFMALPLKGARGIMFSDFPSIRILQILLTRLKEHSLVDFVYTWPRDTTHPGVDTLIRFWTTLSKVTELLADMLTWNKR